MTYELRPAFVRVDDLVKQWVIDVTDHIDTFEDCYGESDIDRVENEDRSGFIAFTAGGWSSRSIADMYQAHSYCCVPTAIQPYIDDEVRRIEIYWDEEHPDHPYSSLYGDGVEDTDEIETLREEFSEFERSCMEDGGTYYYETVAMYHDTQSYVKADEPEVTFRVGINTDFGHGRSSETDWLWEKTIKAADLNEIEIDALVAEAKKGLENA